MASKTLVELSTKGVILKCVESFSQADELVSENLASYTVCVLFVGLMIGVPIILYTIYTFQHGCFGILGNRPRPADFGPTFNQQNYEKTYMFQ